MDSLQFAREIWKEFNLSNSKGAGMTLTIDEVVTKRHGYQFNTDNFNVMGQTIVDYRKPVEKTPPSRK
jgi:hypothetical protein